MGQIQWHYRKCSSLGPGMQETSVGVRISVVLPIVVFPDSVPVSLISLGISFFRKEAFRE